MLFNTLDFALFLVVVYGLYRALPHRGQNRLLLVASYFFYGCWDPRFVLLLFFTTSTDFFLARAIDASSDERWRRRLLVTSIVLNLGVLGFFKYFGFFVDSAALLLARLGVETSPTTLRILLPVGISFYTFQELSYTVDVYRRRLPAVQDYLDFALFVSFFPQLVAGPIERAERLVPQIQAPRRIDWERTRSGLWLILWGTFKKVYVADNLAHLVDGVYDPAARPVGLEVWLATYGFAFQVFCDFSGYTDVARGAARLLGFELMRNFELPYFATSLRELWNRWHISLTTWLRDYLYIPLGGNRHGRLKQYRNLIATMTICGLWHGAAWTYVLFGFLHGVCLSIQHALKPWTDRVIPRRGAGGWFFRAAGLLFAFHLWCTLVVLFRSPTVAQAWELAATMFTDPRPGLAAVWWVPFTVYVAPMLALQVWQALADDHEVVLRSPLVVRTLVYALLLAGIVLLGEDHGKPFIYFQF